MKITTHTTCFEVDFEGVQGLSQWDTLHGVTGWVDIRSITKVNDGKKIRVIFTSNEIRDINCDDVEELNGVATGITRDVLYDAFIDKKFTELAA